MSIAVTCSCGKQLRAKAELAGKTVVCPSCRAKVMVPGPEPAAAEPPPTLAGRRGWLVVAGVVLALALAGGGAAIYFGRPRDAGPPPVLTTASTAVVTASPNPVPAGPDKFGATTVTWDTGDGTPGEVYVTVNGEAEKLFAGGQVKGSLAAPWI